MGSSSVDPTDRIVLDEWSSAAQRGTLMEDLRQMRSTNPNKALTSAQVAEFDQRGFLLPLRAISEGEAAEVRRKIEHAEVEAQQGGNGLFTNAHTLYDWFYALATKDCVVDVVEDLIGPNIMIWKSQLWIKESGSGSYVGWVCSLFNNPCSAVVAFLLICLLVYF